MNQRPTTKTRGKYPSHSNWAILVLALLAAAPPSSHGDIITDATIFTIAHTYVDHMVPAIDSNPGGIDDFHYAPYYSGESSSTSSAFGYFNYDALTLFSGIDSYASYDFNYYYTRYFDDAGHALVQSQSQVSADEMHLFTHAFSSQNFAAGTSGDGPGFEVGVLYTVAYERVKFTLTVPARMSYSFSAVLQGGGYAGATVPDPEHPSDFIGPDSVRLVGPSGIDVSVGEIFQAVSSGGYFLAPAGDYELIAVAGFAEVPAFYYPGAYAYIHTANINMQLDVIPTSAAPEPTSAALLLGVGALLALRRRRP